ncbi:glycosyltransferase family A protein [Cryobacterium sp. Y57]|uniref:glycosyltransferase family A protein n=1 Tax=Cryobacterium sp. Y57 TaxID=2048287 RepID=UPI000CE34039|nr:glycosyltransferase family 2 protein [Cryobacterium sp. Y57]
MGSDHGTPFELSIIIPSYNSARWLTSTLSALQVALSKTAWRAEVIVVDDGSTDDSVAVIAALVPEYTYPLRVVSQSNQGRFLARWTGLQESQGSNVLLLDSRVLLAPDSLHHIAQVQRDNPSETVWNGHAVTDPTSSLVGHFWEVPIHIFWGGYLAHPRPTQLTLQNYNTLPKGTGVFLAPRELLIAACEHSWPVGDAALASDDTKVLRFIAEAQPIRLDPGFMAIYRPRTTVKAFISHSFGRGTFLVDSFGGTSWPWNLALAVSAVAPVVILATLVFLVAVNQILLAAGFIVFCVLLLVAPAAAAAARRCPARGIQSYFLYAAVFIFPYWIGLVRGLKVHGTKLLSVQRTLATTGGTQAK